MRIHYFPTNHLMIEEKKKQLIPGSLSYSKILKQIVAIEEAVIKLACHK
jgi:hypothetical protein